MPSPRLFVLPPAVALLGALLGPAALSQADSLPAPSGLQVAFAQWDHGTDRVDLSWTAPTSPDQPVDHYVVLTGSTATAATQTATIDGAQTQAEVDVIPGPGNVASFAVYAVYLVDDVGYRGPATDTVVATDLPSGPALHAEPQSGAAGKVILSWDAPATGDVLALRQVVDTSTDSYLTGTPIPLPDPTTAGTLTQDIGVAAHSPTYELFEVAGGGPGQYSPPSWASSYPAPKPVTVLFASMHDDPTQMVLSWGLPTGCPSAYWITHCLRVRVAVADGTVAPTGPADGILQFPAIGQPPIENVGTTVTGLELGHTYTVSVFNTGYSPEAYSPAFTKTLVWKDGGNYDPVGSVPTIVTYGSTVTFRATLREHSDQAGLPGVATTLSVTHGTAVVPVANGTTDSLGNITLAYRPSTSGTYELSTPESATHWTIDGPSFSVAVRPVISLGLSHYSVHHGTTVTVGGTFSPHLATHLILERYYSGHWHAAGTLTTTATGHYSAHVRPTAKGTYTYRVVRSGTSTLATGVSRTVRLYAS